MARQFLTYGEFKKWNSLSMCPVKKRVRCFRSNGRPKPCTYGDAPDCSKCGCAAVAVYRGAFEPFDVYTFRLILGLMVPQLKLREDPQAFIEGPTPLA
jgi:hypothetical protein